MAKNRETDNYGMMSVDLLENIVKKAFDEAEKTCTFAFQGGEPTLVGLAFYKKLVAFQKQYNPPV